MNDKPRTRRDSGHLRTSLAAATLVLAGVTQAGLPEAGDLMGMDPLTMRPLAAGAADSVGRPTPDTGSPDDALSIWYAPDLRRWQPASVLPEPQRSARARSPAAATASLA